MLKRLLLLLFIAIAAPPAQAASDVVRDRIVQDLRADGFTDIRVTRTWLGRMRFLASSRDAEREIVVNPVNGVILRDYIRYIRRPSDARSGSGSGSGQSYDDDDYDDEYDEDYEDEHEDDEEEADKVDNSGPGSTSSGSGSGH